jgi:O-antigen ligase
MGGLAGAGLLSTFSRGPIMAFGMGLLILVVAYRRLRPYLLAAATALALFLAYDLLRENSFLADRINDTDNVTLRLKLWETAWAMFTDHPLFGTGLGAFPLHQIEVIRLHGIGPFFEMGDGRLETVNTAEEGFLQFAAETGVVGLACAGLLFGAVARICIPALFRGQEPARGLIMTSGAATVVYLGVGLTVTVYNSWEAASLLPIFLAALANVRGLEPVRQPAPARAVSLTPRIAGAGSESD